MVSVRTFCVMYDHIFFYKQVQISRSDIRPHIKWAVSLVILHMVTSMSLQGLCGYIWVNILTLSPQRVSVITNQQGLYAYNVMKINDKGFPLNCVCTRHKVQAVMINTPFPVFKEIYIKCIL